MCSNAIRAGQVWKVTGNFKMTPYGFEGCIIPKDTRVIILSTPIPLLQKFYYIMPLISKGLDGRLIPNIENMKHEKEGYGVPINKYHFKQWFILDENQEIKFDNSDAEKFWNFISGKCSLYGE